MIEQNQKLKDISNSEETLFVLKELSSNSRLTQRNLAQKIGISLGKANYLVRELAKKGLVKTKNFSKGNHKLNRISYILTPKGLKEKTKLTFHFLKRKQAEYENLRKEWENLEGTFPERKLSLKRLEKRS